RYCVTSAAVDAELRIMVKDIDDEKRLLHGAGRRRSVHTNFKVPDPPQRTPRRVPLRPGQQADIRSGNSQRCKVVFQRTAHEKTSRLDGRPHDCQLRHYETLAAKLMFRKTGAQLGADLLWAPKHKISKTNPFKIKWAPA